MAQAPVYQHFGSMSVLSFYEVMATTGKETEDSLVSVCEEAVKSPSVASVCVLPSFVKSSKQKLQQKAPSSGPCLVCAALNFPEGKGTTDDVCLEATGALKDGADEFECLIDWNQMNADATLGADRIRLLVGEVKKVIGPKTLKVVLEAGQLQGGDAISRAAIAALEGGADFLQTSSGRSATHATAFAVHLMSIAIKDYRSRESERIVVVNDMPKESQVRPLGLKVELGDVHEKEALEFLLQVSHENGAAFMTRETFRIGGTVRLLAELRKNFSTWTPPDVSGGAGA